MFRKTTAEVAAVALALTVLASVAQAETTELTDAQMDQITAGVFLVVGGVNLQDSSENLFIRQAVPTEYLAGTVLWRSDLADPIRYFPANGPSPAYAVGTLIGPGEVRNTGGYTAPT